MLRDKCAVVTGSTSGIGLGVAQALAAQGAAVMLNGFGEPSQIEAMRRALSERYDVPVAFHGADLATSDGPSELIAAAHEALGSVDILVNNAGIQHVAPVEDFPIERWNAIIALNLSAVFLGMRAAIPHMRRRGWGRIINIASAHGLVASVHKVAYVAAKHGVLGATKVAALELANSGVTVNAICTGWVLTPLVEAQIAARAEANGTSSLIESEALLSEKQPMLSFTRPDAIGALAQYLCSNDAATMTGAALPIDGGWTAQ